MNDNLRESLVALFAVVCVSSAPLLRDNFIDSVPQAEQIFYDRLSTNAPAQAVPASLPAPSK